MQRNKHIPISITAFSNLTPSVTISVTFGDKTCRSTLQTTVQLSQTLRSFLKPRHLKICDRFDQFRLVSHDRVEGRFGLVRGSYVRQRIAEVARTLQFMDVTRLVPSLKEIYAVETWSKQHRLPGQDHATTWFDPETRALVMMDEPYGYVDHQFKNRSAWAEENGFEVRRTNWGGTYQPEHGSLCDLVTRVGKAGCIDRIMDRLANAEPGFREATAVWTLRRSP